MEKLYTKWKGKNPKDLHKSIDKDLKPIIEELFKKYKEIKSFEWEIKT